MVSTSISSPPPGSVPACSVPLLTVKSPARGSGSTLKRSLAVLDDVTCHRPEPRVSSTASKRDAAVSRQHLLEVEEAYQLDSGGVFPFPEHLRIDNQSLSPRVVAEQIAAHFTLI